MATQYLPITTLAKQIEAYRKANPRNGQPFPIGAIASDVGKSRTLISQYLTGKYTSDPTTVEFALRQFLENNAPEYLSITEFQAPQVLDNPPESASIYPDEAEEIEIPVKPAAFFESYDARNIIGICSACQKYGRMGQIIGKSGRGKTFSVKHYAKKPNVAYIRCNAVMGNRDLIRKIEAALGIGKKNYGTIDERIEGITKFLNDHPGYLIIIDEANKLLNRNTQTKIDNLLDIYDNAKVGIVLVGEVILKHLISSYLERMENRSLYEYELVGLSAKELDKYLKGYHIEPDAMAELYKRAFEGRKSYFRLLDTTLTNVFDLLKESECNVISLDVIQQSSDWMPL